VPCAEVYKMSTDRPSSDEGPEEVLQINPPRIRLCSLILLANPPLFFTQSNRRGTEPSAPNEPLPQTTAPAAPRRIAAHLGDASTPTAVMVVSTINTGPHRGGLSPPSAAASSLPSTVAPPPLTAAPPPPTLVAAWMSRRRSALVVAG
jgi:hypothetical protein